MKTWTNPALKERYRDYLASLYCRMKAGPARVAVLEKLNGLNCWEDGE